MKKNILMIAPVFFDYYRDIISEMEKQGHTVTFYDDRPSEKLFFKALARKSTEKVRKKVDKYVQKIICDSKTKEFDTVFVILGQCFLREHIQKLRNHFSNSKFIYYSWDSATNFPNILKFHDLFDKVFSFDSRDCKVYGFDLLPLYYSKDIPESKETLYSFSTIFTAKRGKMKKFEFLMNLLPEDAKKNSFVYIYLQSRFVFLYYKLFYKEFRRKKERDFHFKKLSRDDFYDIMSKSKIIIDVQMKNQSGLTMRTIEALRAKKKVITTNPNIVDYDFYTPTNICVLNKNHQSIPDSFFETDFDENFSIDDSYSVGSFVHRILS